MTFRCGFFATNRSPFLAPLHPGSAVGSASPSERHACVEQLSPVLSLLYPPFAGEAIGDGQGDF